MDSIQLRNIAVSFEKGCVFKNITFLFTKNTKSFILGQNGSGKSTLIKVISGVLEPDEGTLNFINQSLELEKDLVFSKISMASPYLNLFEDLTLEEHIRFHFSLKQPLSGLSVLDVLNYLSLPGQQNKKLRSFSSGMKQKVKLALAILSDTPVLLLDEPCSNLDQKNTAWYHDMIAKYTQDRIVIVASNYDEREMGFCTSGITLN